MILLIILILALNYLSGYPVYRLFFKKQEALQIIFVPQILGLFVLPAIFSLITSLVNFDAAVMVSPMIIIVLSALSFFKVRKQETGNKSFDKRIIPIFLLLFVAVLLGALAATHFVIISDPGFHMSASIDILNSKTLPPDTSCLPGEKFAYSWFSHLSASIFSVYSGITILTFYNFYGLYTFTLFFSISYIVLRSHLKSKNVILLGLSLMLIYTIGFGSFFLHSAQSTAFPLLALFFYSILLSLKNPDAQYKILAGFLAGSMIYIHALTFSFSLLILFSLVLYKLLDFKIQSIKSAICYLAPLIISIPYTIFLSEKVSSLYLFEPLSGLHTIYNYINYVNIFALAIPFAVYRSIKSKDEIQTVLAMCLITVLIFVNIFVMARSPNIERNAILLFFPTILIGLNYLESLDVKIKIGFSVLAIVLFLQPALVDINNTFFVDHGEASKGVYASYEYNISSWIKANSGKDDAILAAPFAVYTGLSERKAVICNPDFLRGLNYNKEKLKSSFADLLTLYSNPSKELIEKHKIKYAIFGPREKEFLQKYDITPVNFANSTTFEKAYQAGDYQVYSINKESLPEKTQLYTNFTSYSRWWEI